MASGVSGNIPCTVCIIERGVWNLVHMGIAARLIFVGQPLGNLCTIT